MTQAGLINLSVEINKSTPVLTGLRLTDPQLGQFLGDGGAGEVYRFRHVKVDIP